MKFVPAMALTALTLLPLVAQPEDAAAPVRVYIGMVADEREGAPEGLLVRAVAPNSPANKAGVRVGDVVLRVGQVSTNSRADLRGIVDAGALGDSLAVELLRGGRPLTLHVVLEKRPPTSARRTAEAALGADRRIHPIALPEAIRKEIRYHRRIVRLQLASLPEGLVPSVITEELNAIRNLARDAHAGRPGWMSGQAGEISVRFRDDEGSVVIYGANDEVTLELYDTDGQQLARYPLNTEAERCALPETVLRRLQDL